MQQVMSSLRCDLMLNATMGVKLSEEKISTKS
jgi:hypothetical protein